MRNKSLDALYIPAPRLNQFNILHQIASDTFITQAELARRCDLSVAMVNNYMKELCDGGLLEYHRKSCKSVSYHLTAAGKERVEIIRCDLLREMAHLFEGGKKMLWDRIMRQAPASLCRVVLFGQGNLAELVFHALESAGVQVVGVCDDDPSQIGKEWCGREISSPSQIRYMAPDAVVIAVLARFQEIYDSLKPLEDRGIRLISLVDKGEETKTSLPLQDKEISTSPIPSA
jgi:predicted transcriptional regulator